MYKRYSRQLSESETRHLNKNRNGLLSESKFWNLIKKNFIVSFVGGIILGILVILSSDVPIEYPIYFMLGITLLYTTWGFIENKVQISRQINNISKCLDINEVFIDHVQSSEMIEFEEIDDEGACYCFEIDQSKLLFITGQDFYKSKKFPSTDFDIVSAYGNSESIVLFKIYGNGDKLEPRRIIPWELKEKLRQPDHLEIIEGNLKDIENILKS